MDSKRVFRVNYKCVVEIGGRMEPDAQARREYKEHFGELDLKDLQRRYREAKRASEIREREAELKRAACVEEARVHAPAPKRLLVQSTLSRWTASQPSCGA